MGHFEGKGLQEVYIDDDGSVWSGPDKKVRLSEKNWQPYDGQEKEVQEIELKQYDMPPELPENPKDYPTKEKRRQQLLGTRYLGLRKAYGIPAQKGLKHADLVDIILEKEGYGY
jgi:hypothetical protein